MSVSNFLSKLLQLSKSSRLILTSFLFALTTGNYILTATTQSDTQKFVIAKTLKPASSAKQSKESNPYIAPTIRSKNNESELGYRFFIGKDGRRYMQFGNITFGPMSD